MFYSSDINPCHGSNKDIILNLFCTSYADEKAAVFYSKKKRLCLVNII